jgi:hypothetical protein
MEVEIYSLEQLRKEYIASQERLKKEYARSQKKAEENLLDALKLQIPSAVGLALNEQIRSTIKTMTEDLLREEIRTTVSTLLSDMRVGTTPSSPTGHATDSEGKDVTPMAPSVEKDVLLTPSPVLGSPMPQVVPEFNVETANIEEVDNEDDFQLNGDDIETADALKKENDDMLNKKSTTEESEEAMRLESINKTSQDPQSKESSNKKPADNLQRESTDETSEDEILRESPGKHGEGQTVSPNVKSKDPVQKESQSVKSYDTVPDDQLQNASTDEPSEDLLQRESPDKESQDLLQRESPDKESQDLLQKESPENTPDNLLQEETQELITYAKSGQPSPATLNTENINEAGSKAAKLNKKRSDVPLMHSLEKESGAGLGTFDNMNDTSSKDTSNLSLPSGQSGAATDTRTAVEFVSSADVTPQEEVTKTKLVKDNSEDSDFENSGEDNDENDDGSISDVGIHLQKKAIP